jgi:hypothetical protein
LNDFGSNFIHGFIQRQQKPNAQHECIRSLKNKSVKVIIEASSPFKLLRFFVVVIGIVSDWQNIKDK